MSPRIKAVTLAAALLIPALHLTAGDPDSTNPVDFNRDIRPLLSDNCFACHGPDDKARKASLQLDLKQTALKPTQDGGLIIDPGSPKTSRLIQRITASDPDDLMPPPDSGKKLSPAQINLFTRWITEGAEWKSHWAFETLTPPPPAITQNHDWQKNEIDDYILEQLEKNDLQPSPPADKPTLIRRASLDLTGLPPTPREIDAYLADDSPQAYEKLVDKLLDKPAYGEHMARYWLDAARYADSHGYHIDSERSIWKYREWVINAFNRNIPFDQFTTEQLAGDLLPEPTTDQLTASGYVRCNMSTGEGGAIVEEYQAKYTFDRAETSATVWLGLTLTCARCHTHKFDPITHHEYYSLYAFFNNLDEAIMDENKPNPKPFINVPSRQQTERQEWLRTKIADARKRIEAPMPELDREQAQWDARWRQELNNDWISLTPSEMKGQKDTTFKLLDDSSILLSGENPPQDVHSLTFKLNPGPLHALRLQSLPHDSLPQKSAARSDNGSFRLSGIEAELTLPDINGETGKPQPLQFTTAVADAAVKHREPDKAIDNKTNTGWEPDNVTQPHTLVLINQPIDVQTNATLHIRLRYEASDKKQTLGRFRLAATREEKVALLIDPPKEDPWQLLGPFKTDNLTHGFNTDFGPEQNLDLKQKYNGARGEIAWEPKEKFTDGQSHLLVHNLHGIHGAYYLHRTLKLPTARSINLGLRADDRFKIWVNGEPAGQRDQDEEPGEGPLQITADLNAGDNEILVKIVTHTGNASFLFTKDLDTLDSLPANLAAHFATTDTFNKDQETQARDFFRRLRSPDIGKLMDRAARWRDEDNAITKNIPTTMIAKERTERRDTFLLIRGEYDQHGEKVSPGVPAIFPPLPAGAPTNRLGLARWLVQPSHPLTSRVTVNRFWQQYFGTGLVKTTEDFGRQGDLPSHPALLDWLATEFIQSGWNIKHLQKQIVTSATYQQSSRLTPDRVAKDPENRLLSRGPRFRLDAESVRDTVLAVSGLLVDHLGGRSVKPYEPPGLWEAVSFNNSQKYVPETGPGQYRRSLYTHWKRQSPPPNMLIFDAPTREFCSVRRSRSNTPLQALVLLNDPQFVQASRAFGQRILVEGPDNDDDRIRFAFRLATARLPQADELELLRHILNQQLAHYRDNPDAAKQLLNSKDFKANRNLDQSELAAWVTLANLLLNLDELVTKG